MVIENFNTGKNYTALLLSLFDNLQLRKLDNTLYTIPIVFGNKSRLYAKLSRASTGKDKEVSLRVPALSLSLNNWTPNNTRKTSKMLKRKVIDIDGSNVGITWNDKPVDYSFTLTLLTKGITELTNISEAIISTFKDDLYYIDYKTPIGDVISTPIVMESAEINIDNNESDYLDDRLLESKFEFKVEGIIHSQITSINKRVNTIDAYIKKLNDDIDLILEQYHLPE